MADKHHRKIPAPPPASASDRVKAAYYRRHDPVELIDAGYFEEDGLYVGDRCVVDLRPERGLVCIPIDERVARQLYRAAKRSGNTPSGLASRCLAAGLQHRAAG